MQRDLYDLVHAAQQAGIDAVRPGAPFLAAHNAAMEVLAHGLADLGLLPGLGGGGPRPGVEGLRPLDAARHLAHARHGRPRLRPRLDDIYPKGDLAEGMVLTVEPGLYFQQDDLLVPEELRGIGIRIEDDILVTADGSTNLSAALPRTSAEVEEWMGRLRG